VIRRGKSAAAGAAQPPAPVAMAQTPTIDTCLWPIPSAPTRWAQAMPGRFAGAGGRRRPPNLQPKRVWMQAARASLLVRVVRLRGFRQASGVEAPAPCPRLSRLGRGRVRRQAPARRSGRQRAFARAVRIDGQGALPHAPRPANASRGRQGQILDPIRDVSSPRHVGTPEGARRARVHVVQPARNFAQLSLHPRPRRPARRGTRQEAVDRRKIGEPACRRSEEANPCRSGPDGS
jgi:hypothetical protein